MKINKLICTMILLCGTVATADMPVKAASCVACHGSDGISSINIWPNLAGQKQLYLEKQLKDFRSGKRVDDIMNREAKLLTDKEIKVLAAYFSKMEN